MKKKMKKIFSKITTLVLLVAMLIPYTSIPKVEAATDSCDGEWEYHTNYYFFLQAEHPNTWISYLTTGNGSTQTNYYTSFLYNFPSDGSKIEFLDEGFVKITDSDKYDTDFETNSSTNRKSWTAGQFYYEFQKEADSSEFGEYKSYAYTSGNGKGTDENRIVEYLFHGDWANLGNGENVTWDLNKVQIKDTDETLTLKAKISSLVDSSIIIDKTASELSDVKIGAAGISNGKLNYQMSWVKDAIENYNMYASTNDKVKYQETGVVQYISEIKNPVINLVIGRKYENEDIFTKSVTLKEDSGAYKVEISGNSYNLKTLGEAEEGYITYNDGSNDIAISAQKSVIIKDSNKKNIAWFLAPTLYQMSYRVCRTSNTSEDQVTLSYDGNAPKGTASNIPDAVTQATGTDFVVSSKTPELDGYKFKSWNTKSSCDGKTIEPETTLEKLTNNTTLYACWGETGTTSNKKTGVATYAGLFTGIIALAGGSYYLIKKKNLFKKI